MAHIKDIYEIFKENPEIVEYMKKSFLVLYKSLKKPDRAPNEKEILVQTTALILDDQFVDRFKEPKDYWMFLFSLVRNCVAHKGRGVLLSNMYVKQVVYFPYRNDFGEACIFNNQLFFLNRWYRPSGLLGPKKPLITRFYAVKTDSPVDTVFPLLKTLLDEAVKMVGKNEEDRFAEKMTSASEAAVQKAKLQYLTHLQILSAGGFTLRSEKFDKVNMDYDSTEIVRKAIFDDINYVLEFSMY